eukprot:TRINITY_DN27468_c0_g1_i1.p1 TRINITY_DN27468_c0_g1~~TRINITY_DN27468_c0_g1_i1.p1  ORF type:complete len:179 (+),score=49.29 TRINITY_DN27468_c0_g1_i1:80-538(+)
MSMRVNDPGHFEAEPLPETVDMLGNMKVHKGEPRPVKEYEDSPSECEDRGVDVGGEGDGGDGGEVKDFEFWRRVFLDGGWQEHLAGIEPERDDNGMLSGGWGLCLEAAVRLEHSGEKEMGAGEVIDHLCNQGYEGFCEAADKREQLEHSKFE